MLDICGEGDGRDKGEEVMAQEIKSERNQAPPRFAICIHPKNIAEKKCGASREATTKFEMPRSSIITEASVELNHWDSRRGFAI